MSKNPWMKFYPSDWRSDPALRMCSRAARSFWIDLLSLMHEAEPYGHLVIRGVNPNILQLSSVVGDPQADVVSWLEELEMNGVFSRTKDGIIFSRRMVRDAQKSLTNTRNGQNGGNPSLKRSDNRKAEKSDNQNCEASFKAEDKAQKLEARDIDICPLQDSADAKSEAPKPEARSKRAKARTSLSEDWKLGDREREHALTEGMPAAVVDLQARKFRDHHIAKGSLMADWAAAWRTWVTNYKGFNPSLPLTAPARSDDATRWEVLYSRWQETGRWREERDGPPPYQPGHRGPMKVKPAHEVAA